MSINDIRSILNPLTEKYFGNDDGFTMQDVYTEVFSLEAEESQKLLKDLGKNTRLPVRHLRIFLMRIRNFFTHSALSAC